MHQPHIRTRRQESSTAVCPPTGDVFVGRQPIYNRQLEVIGYELLFRNGTSNTANVTDGDQATAQVLLHTFVDIGLETLVGHQRAFVNLTRAFLNPDVLQVLPRDQIVLELLEELTVDDDLIETVRGLSAEGYIIALDDFIYHDSLQPLVELADIIKLDVRTLDHAALEEHVALLRPYDVTLLAEKIETPEEFRATKAMGFEWFQGYFFCRPDVVQGQQIPTNRMALLHLLAQLQDPTLDVATVEALVSRDVTLSYKLLRLVNTATVGMRRTVDSLRQAIRLLGIRSVTTWTSLLLMASAHDNPPELLTTALVRTAL